MKISRDGDTFDVRILNDDWQFWEKRFADDWEPETKAVVDRFVDGGLFVDIGAWVGPVSLWAGARGARVIAAEPDMVAFEHLVDNLRSNHVGFHAESVAISDRDGVAELGQRTGWGDSMSSLVGPTFDPVEVECSTLASFLGYYDLTDLQLVKIDIEGAEGLVIPQAEPFLRSLGVPVYLSLHPQWWTEDPRPYLAGWTCEQIAEYEAVYLP